jgi:GTP-binding protein
VKDAIISVLLIDAETGITTQDKKIASLIVSEKKGLIIAANKWDRAKDSGINPREFIKDVYFYFPHISFADVITISAKTGYNKIKLLKNILTVYNNYTLKIKTSELNSFIRNIDLHGAHIKYGIQKSTAPPVFEFFISRSSEKNRNFKQFINNSIRKKFDLTGVPIEVNLRKK